MLFIRHSSFPLGDGRVNEHPYLGTIHTVFHLCHNRLVRELVKRKLQINKGNQCNFCARLHYNDVDRFLNGMSDYKKDGLFKV